MLDNGYSLARFELLNWGNFHGLQRFDLRAPHNAGPLFQAPSASAILGINGSGKSTLIDALMIVLLPFEGSVKLGVTNDVESGSSGGRTIRDYVLGKHSSTAGRDGGTLAASMGRKDGCSMVVLTFWHNRNPDRTVTLGRAWWYQNYDVSDTQLAFLSYDPITLAQLCHEGKTPKAPKYFRQHVKERLPQIQVFDTMQAYFSALSGSLGKVSRDDLRILNRAFFVKSISQIDQFIRENMLLEQANPHLDRLLENVRNGKEIAFAIETCEKKLAGVERILKDLRRLAETAEQKSDLERQELVLRLHKDWDELRRQRDELEKLSAQILLNEASLPELKKAIESGERQHASLQSLIVHSDLDARLQKLALELAYLGEQAQRQSARYDLILKRSIPLGIRIPNPSRAKDWLAFESQIKEGQAARDQKVQETKFELDKYREEKFLVENQAKAIREELQHLASSKTLIPKDLHSIKLEALEQLKIPGSHLRFVGELIQVPASESKFRLAVEAVLAPVSRNLLCHPDCLEAFTKWLNAKGLRADLVAKRISIQELDSEEGGWQGSARKAMRSSNSPELPEDCVLDKIEILPES